MIKALLIAALITIGNGFPTTSPEAISCSIACSERLGTNYDIYAWTRNAQGQALCRCFGKEEPPSTGAR